MNGRTLDIFRHHRHRFLSGKLLGFALTDNIELAASDDMHLAVGTPYDFGTVRLNKNVLAASFGYQLSKLISVNRVPFLTHFRPHPSLNRETKRLLDHGDQLHPNVSESRVVE